MSLQVNTTSPIEKIEEELPETIEKESQTRKKTFFKDIDKLNFSFEPSNKTILDQNNKATKAVYQYKESCKKLKEAVNDYKNSEKGSTKSNKFKIKSALGMKLSLGKMDEFVKSIDNTKFNNNFKSDEGAKIVFSCNSMAEEIAKLRKSIKPVSPINIKIRKKLSGFEKQLYKNLDIWNEDPQNPKGKK